MVSKPASIRTVVPTMDPVDQFRARLLSMKPGEWYMYHAGVLSRDRAKAPSLNQIAMIASGLQSLKVVQLRQERFAYIDGKATGDKVMDEKKTVVYYHYKLRTNRPIRNVDFDHGRKTYLENLKEE